MGAPPPQRESMQKVAQTPYTTGRQLRSSAGGVKPRVITMPNVRRHFSTLLGMTLMYAWTPTDVRQPFQTSRCDGEDGEMSLPSAGS